MTSAVHCTIEMRFECPACGRVASTGGMRVTAGDPYPRPEHHLPPRWHVMDGYAVCPLHRITLAPEGPP